MIKKAAKAAESRTSYRINKKHNIGAQVSIILQTWTTAGRALSYKSNRLPIERFFTDCSTDFPIKVEELTDDNNPRY